MRSKRTKRYLGLYILFFVLSIITTFAPLVAITMMAIVQSNGIVITQIGLVSSVFVTAICCCLNFLFKTEFKAYIWAVLLAVYMALDNFLFVLVLLTITSFVDEMIFNPAAKAFKSRYVINKEIDHRSV